MSPAPSKSQLVILDAGIVIEAFRTNSWPALIQRYAIVLSRTVVGEALFYKDASGTRVPIKLEPYELAGQISVIDIPVAELDGFLKQFDPTYIERLHAGELESLCYLLNHTGAAGQISSADSIVFKVLGKLRISDRGVSLEELLRAIGAPKPLAEKYTKTFRERWSREGFSDSFQ